MSDLFMRRVISLFIGVPVFHHEGRFGIDLDVGILFQRAAAHFAEAPAQDTVRTFSQRQVVEPCRVEVAFSKTLHILFPSEAVYVDLGSLDLIADKADGARNVVRVKAAKQGFEGETNFSVHHGRRMLLLFHGGLFRKSFPAQHRDGGLTAQRSLLGFCKSANVYTSR